MSVPEIEALTGERLANLRPSEDLGARPEFRWIPKTQLVVDHAYQRSAKTERSVRMLRKMVETLHWAKFQPITVTEVSGGKFAAIDGQHRALAALHHPLITEVPCWITQAKGTKAQAGIFVAVNSDRQQMTPMQIFRAELAAGDEEAQAVVTVIEKAGLKIAWNIAAQGVPAGHTQSIATVKTLLKRDGEEQTLRTLRILASAHGDRPGQMRAEVIKAVALVLKVHGARLDQLRLTRVISQYDCDQLQDAARAYRKMFGGTTVSGVADALIKAYDKGLSGENRLVRSAA